MGSGVMPPLPTGVVKAQVQRMAGLDFFPREVEAIRELVRTLATRCLDEQHVKRVVDGWLATHAEAPKPVDLLELIADTRPATANKPDPECRDCQGTGWIITERDIPTLWGVRTLSAAEPCRCRKSPREALGRADGGQNPVQDTTQDLPMRPTPVSARLAGHLANEPKGESR